MPVSSLHTLLVQSTQWCIPLSHIPETEGKKVCIMKDTNCAVLCEMWNLESMFLHRNAIWILWLYWHEHTMEPSQDKWLGSSEVLFPNRNFVKEQKHKEKEYRTSIWISLSCAELFSFQEFISKGFHYTFVLKYGVCMNTHTHTRTHTKRPHLIHLSVCQLYFLWPESTQVSQSCWPVGAEQGAARQTYMHTTGRAKWSTRPSSQWWRRNGNFCPPSKILWESR